MGPRDPEGLRPLIPLEDTYERLRKRLWLITDEVEGNLFFATRAETLGKGLLDQLAMFYDEHPDLKLVVIDTLQMIRSSVHDYSYSSDYRELADLKRFADQRSITILLIHHTRKMGDSDVMNTVSGTNAITGAADFTWVLTEPNRDSQDGTPPASRGATWSSVRSTSSSETIGGTS